MKTRNTKSKVLAVCLFVALAAPAAVFANNDVESRRPKAKCKPIFAVQRDVLVQDGCSNTGFCAAGTFRGNHGFSGASYFNALSFDAIRGDAFGRLVVPGISTYTTDDGAITINDVSVFDTARGTFAGIGRIVEGTGRFAGATGDIFTTGRMSPDGQSFTTDVSGEICLPQ